MGGTTSKTYEEAINDVVNNIMSSATTQCNNAMLQNSLNNINCKAGINLNGINITQTGNMTTNCSANLASTTNITNSISTELSSEILTKMQALLSAASKADSEVHIKMQTNIKNTVTNAAVQNCINSAFQNEMNNIVSNGFCNLSNIAITQSLSQTTSCVSQAIIQNLVDADIIDKSKLQNVFTQDNPISGVINAIGDAVSNAISSITKGPAELLIMFFVFILIIIVIYKFATSGSSQPTVVYEHSGDRTSLTQ
jgi:hypothetical protein